MRILLVEDHAPLAREVASKVERAGYGVDHVGTIEGAIQALDDCLYSVALLDRRLPDGDAIAIIPRIREKQPDIRIMMLTALDAVDARIDGLEAGADDYLTKPFNLDELIARIRVQLRGQGRTALRPVEIGALSFDLDQRIVAIRGEEALLTRQELLLLEALVRSANRIVSREALYAQLYGRGMEVQEHALTSLVSRLRARLAELDAGVEIRSARSLGYRIKESRGAAEEDS
ncbi:DNA-binding response regulator (plasmid) [Methylosinus sp. C49]|uniref:response regulator transcription factor n=1 Tax=Methylosinus sp. C49 TaxID=2699395 RepID=UPI00136789A7|nr:response regulator transcription factor [Methylosinus sp. C49]BBU63731.1 DNA-binding response regulator [Methylosinus sp. C49]